MTAHYTLYRANNRDCRQKIMSFVPSRKFGTNKKSRRRNQRQPKKKASAWPKNKINIQVTKVFNPTRLYDSLPDDFVETLAATPEWRFLVRAEAVLDEVDEHVRNEKAQALMRVQKRWEKTHQYRRHLQLWSKYGPAHSSHKHPPKYGQIYYKGKYVDCPLEPEMFCRCSALGWI